MNKTGLDAPPLLWRDYLQTLHLCEYTDLHQVFVLISTVCGRNVPPNAHWPRDLQNLVTCPECSRRRRDIIPRARHACS